MESNLITLFKNYIEMENNRKKVAELKSDLLQLQAHIKKKVGFEVYVSYGGFSESLYIDFEYCVNRKKYPYSRVCLADEQFKEIFTEEERTFLKGLNYNRLVIRHNTELYKVFTDRIINFYEKEIEKYASK